MRFGVLGGLALLSAIWGTSAAAVTVPSFNGTYDEATGSEAAGDYDNIGGLAEVGEFALHNGTNTFLGSIFTPTDPSDVFNIVVGAGQILTGASIVYGTNATMFNPTFGFPAPQWTLQESSVTPVIFDLGMPGSVGAPASFAAPAFTRGPGNYSMLIGNGVFAMNNGGGIGYTMTFEVQGPLAPVPLPAGLPLVLAGPAMLFALRRARHS
jgi:hypothetical protein